MVHTSMKGTRKDQLVELVRDLNRPIRRKDVADALEDVGEDYAGTLLAKAHRDENCPLLRVEEGQYDLTGRIPDGLDLESRQRLEEARKRAGLSYDEAVRLLKNNGHQIAKEELIAWEEGTLQQTPTVKCTTAVEVFSASQEADVTVQKNSDQEEVSNLSDRTPERGGREGSEDRKSSDTREIGFQPVPEIGKGFDEDSSSPPNKGQLILPKQYIRQRYGIRPDRIVTMHMRGDSMEDTLSAGQRILAVRWEKGQQLKDGAIYGLHGGAGLTIKRVRFDRKNEQQVIWIWADNPDYADQRYYLTQEEFGQEYEVVAWALEASQKL
jgi:phage repressor protein C with HTH and peptisase S24 domain